MGNQMSVPQRVEDQENDSEADTHKDQACGQNGMPVMVSTHSVQPYHEVDLETSVQEDNVATSSPKTMEISAVADANGKNLGKEAKPQTPAAKSRFFLTLSRPVPGRTGDQATDSSTGPVKLDVSSDKALGNKDPSEPMALPVAAALGCDPDKTPVQTPAQAEGLSATLGPESRLSESGGAAPSKPKDSSFFDRLFKLDKGRDKALVDHQQEAKRAEHHQPTAETPGFSTQSDDVPAERDIADGTGDEGQEIPTVSCSVPGVPEGLEVAKEDPQTENNNSIMSFFKTLVSPNKAETKKDLEDTASKAESVCDGQAGQKTSEIQAKGTKKKHLHSPRLGLAFRKFFRHKGAEKSPATSADLKSDKGNVTPQEPQGAAKNSTSTEIAKEGAKEKGGPTSLPLGKLFWKKSVKEDSVPTGAEENVVCESQVEAVKSEEVESALQTVDLSEEGDRTPEPAEDTLKRAERKTPRPSLMALLRQMSVKGDGGITHSEEINGKDSSYQASESTEKAVVPPESEPAAAGQKGKEGSSKDKKASAETEKQKGSKQEAKEPAPRVEPAPVEGNSLRDGDKSQKRLEKRRQSLGGFFKGLGPKRMLDAQVQTDPVSIGPVGKSK
ncbi:breast carcinoma-amplified sequence 1 isoform X1 [Mesoplodon densirostris]|uniref:breast carcinoma-amplified sequence 1 isoform X1 n=1 Tax=Mesoplodon densirostris TaxID=48708 RepID=UPI0028DC519B|nr:breast carcinoma-amplified sequence 1 isoform X1 [Mesoplodon densirostris]